MPKKIPENLVEPYLDMLRDGKTFAEVSRLSGYSYELLKKHANKNSIKAVYRGAPLQSSTIKIPDQTDLAYIAGILDGEGTISFSSPPGIRVYITNTDKKIIDFLLLKIGGTSRLRKERTVNRKPIYVWGLYRMSDIQLFLININKYLIIKKEKSEEALKRLESICP